MLKFISRVRIEFNALEPRAASCLSFLSQCRTPEARTSNPTCEIQVKRHVDDIPPQIAVTFVNGAEQIFDPLHTPPDAIRESILDKSEVVKSEQLFREFGQKWPVLIPEEELRTPFKGVKVTNLGSKKEEVVEEVDKVTLQIKIKSFETIRDEMFEGFR